MADTDLARANQAYEENDWEEAAALYAQVYLDKPSTKVNHLLAQSLFKKGDPAEAAEVMQEDYRSYFSDEYHYLFVIRVLLAIQDTIGANQVRLLAKTQTWLDDAKDLIDAAEERIRKEPWFDEVYRHYYHLADGNPYEQQNRYGKSRQLPLEEWVTATKHVLVDPFVSPLIRVNMLELMNALRIADKTAFLWVDGSQREWVPVNGTGVDDDATMVAVRQYLANYFTQTKFDLTLREQLEKSIIVMTGFLYPYLDEVITDVATWVRIGIARFGFEEALESVDKNNPGFGEMLAWYDRIESFFNEMTG